MADRQTRRIVQSATAILAAFAVSTAAQAQGPLSTFVLLGENGTATARAITTATACPLLKIDGTERPMQVRASPETVPLRATQSSVENSKPSAFPVLACDGVIPKGVKHASIDGRDLPLAPAKIDRIVVIGDTGCRIKESDKAYQACNDPKAYPLATVAAKVAEWKPDVVLHVGDYLYRENSCPEGNAGCAGSPWGYGWDAWDADFFTPAATMLQAVPLILVRGNHESCTRAGQGWWRFLDPRPLEAGRDCNDAAQDVTGDYSPPYAVPLGGGAQIVVMDLSSAGVKTIPDNDPRIAQFGETYTKLDQLSHNAVFTFAANHHPILGIAATEKKGQVEYHAGNPGIQTAFGKLNPAIFPSGVDVLLAGHIHLWQQLSFSTDFPSQFVAGFSGTQEDTVPIPAVLPPDVSPAPGAVIEHFSSWVDGFGYMTLERTGPKTWSATIWNLDGKAVNHCRISGRKSSCDKAQITAASQ